MSKSEIKIVNVETGEESVRDANVEELAQLKNDLAKTKAKIAEEEAKATAKAALLNRLGITAEEAQLLLS
jgi:AmiR/NasT family two-component response regulator